MTNAISYLGRMAEWLRTEQQEDLLIHEAGLKSKSIQSRKEAGITWYPLKVNETGFGIGSYPFIVVERPVDRHRHAFQSGSPVSLFSNQEGNMECSIQGIIGYVDEERMKISFYLDELPDWIDDGKIGVNLLFDTKTYDEMFRALNVVINAEKGRIKELRELLFLERKSEFLVLPNIHSVGLNDSQNKALQDIVAAEDLAVVHGPPGTGKTTTLVAAIDMMASEGKKLLVCAPSNAAVDHLTRSIAAKGIKVVRIGNLAKVEEQTTGYTIDVLLAKEKEFKRIRELKKQATELRKMGGKYKRSFGKEEAEQRKLLFQEAKNLNREARELESYLVSKILEESPVITSTLIGSTHEFIRDIDYDVVVIDEAGQALEAACWVPILKGKKVVLAGDPFQLPPTVKSREAAQKGLSKTMLERLVSNFDRVNLLEVQYRMHEDIMMFSNDQFYSGRLKAHVSNAGHLNFDGDKPLEFLDTAGCGYEEMEGEDSESRQNIEEAKLIMRHFERWRHLAKGDESIAVISPYRAQVKALEELFSSVPNVTVNTIDSFQGQERDVVYISLVRSNEKQEIGFLKDYRRMNVAMTRARKKLVVIGDSATLASDKFYREFIDFTEKKGAYFSAWEYYEG